MPCAIHADHCCERGASYEGATIYPATDAATFFGALTKVGSAKRIIVIGHGTSGEIGLSAGATDKAIGEPELEKYRTTIRSRLKPVLKRRTLDPVHL